MKELLIRTVTGLPFAGIIIISLYYFPPVFVSLLVAMFVWIIAQELPPLAGRSQKRLFWLFLYIAIPFCCLLYLYTTLYRPLVGVIFIVAFCHDSAAYIVGKACGTHFIYPRISPKKSWEGFFAALVAVSCLMLLWPSKVSLPPFARITIGLLAAVTATIGDLFESFLKRTAGLKDAGSLIPGHGGLLDRLDSIFFVTLVATLLRNTLIFYF
jgi:phosphatidate cytidylyltransferase